MNDIITYSNCADKHLLASVAHPDANTVYVLTNIYIMCVLLYTTLLTLCLEYWYQDGLDEFFCRICLPSYDPFVGDVITVPGTVAEGRPCDRCGTPHRTPGAGDIDKDDYSVRHNPDLGDDSLRPDIQEMQRRQEAQNHSDDRQFHRDDSSQTFSCMSPNSMVRDEDMASSKQPDSKECQFSPEFKPAYCPQFGLKSYRSSNVPISSTTIQESTTLATSVNLETRGQIDASSESSVTSSDMEILESNACQKVVQRSHNRTDNNTGRDTGERRYICKTCNKSFNRQDHLVVHNRAHTGERPYSCTDCNKAFYKQNDLTRHIRMHTGERPYKCDQCEMAFTRASIRARHIRGKHPVQ